MSIKVFGDLQPASAVISILDTGGHLRAVSTFGDLPGGAGAYARVSVWDHLPLADAARHESACIANGAQAVEQFPDLHPSGAELSLVAAVHLAIGNRTVGALQITSRTSRPQDVSEADMSAAASMIAWYLELTEATAPVHMEGAPPSEPRPLTERQSTVASLLVQGMTNAQIAARIGFSDSTVRQETMAIYRHLGVHGRHDVERAMAALGIG